MHGGKKKKDKKKKGKGEFTLKEGSCHYECVTVDTHVVNFQRSKPEPSSFLFLG